MIQYLLKEISNKNMKKLNDFRIILAQKEFFGYYLKTFEYIKNYLK